MTDAGDQAPADTDLKAVVEGLDRELANVRKYGERTSRQIHRLMAEDLRLAERRARQAERRAERAERRAAKAEAELAAIRESRTWKAGRVVTGVPARVTKRRKP